MNHTVSEVLSFVEESDIKFVRLGFCDLFGFQKNISIMAEELPSAFENGISFDAHAIQGFRDSVRSDLLLKPDAVTLSILPWRPGPGRVAHFYCDIQNPDGTAFEHSGRHILKQVVKRTEEMGYVCKIGAECEFYLFRTTEDGEPTEQTFDRGGYLDISPLDKGEDIRREICLTLEEMGIKPETSHHERGPGQNEIDFKFNDALACADNLLTLKTAVKTIAARNGLFASFLPKPIADAAGSGLHVNLSLSQNGFNIFKNASGGEHSKVAESFIAGVLARTAEITLFLNPTTNSYERFGSHEAPQYVSWSHQNRSQLIRIPAASGERVRMELRSPDPSINPYLAFALILAAGLEGIENGLALPPAVDVDLFSVGEDVTEGLSCLPKDLHEAIASAWESALAKSVLGEALLAKYIAIKEAEADAFAQATDKAAFCKERYWRIV